MKIFLFLVTAILALIHQGTSVTVREYAPIVKTNHGEMVGIVQEYDEHKVHLYQGIRYGRAERFSKPTPPESWTGVYNATQMQYACAQASVKVQNHVDLSKGFETGSSNEDCLFLNLWRPAAHQEKPRPVMIWIHGGSFEFGSIFSVIYDGRVIASLGDVIVVTINYRLGALGFLYGGTEDAPGNLGLYDQIEAIKWVHENAHAFGGDPKKVTIFGESAGSMSVGALVLSPLTKGLIHRAITQSGAPNSYLGSEEKTKSLEKTKILAEKFKCTGEMKDLLTCLRKVPAVSILEATKGSIANGESFIPIWGEEVMPLNPVQALKTGKFNHIDLMFGVTRNEGSAFVASLLPLLNPDTDGHDLHIAQVKSMINLMMMLFKEPNGQEVVDYYTKNLNESDKTALRIAVSDAFGDYHLICPTILYGEQFAKHTLTHKHYAYRLMRPTTIPVMGCHGWMGVCHAEDVVFMFGIPARIRGLIFSEEEYQLSHDMIMAWTSFAKNGHPGKLGGKVEWTEAYAHETVKHMSLDSVDYKMVDEFFKDKCDAFWKPRIFV